MDLGTVWEILKKRPDLAADGVLSHTGQGPGSEQKERQFGMSNFGKGIDKKIFLPATIVTLALGVVFFAFPEQSNTVLNQIHDFTTHQLGWFFLLAVMYDPARDRPPAFRR